MRSMNRFKLIATIEWAQSWAQSMLCAWNRPLLASLETMEMFVADARRARLVDDVKLPSGAAKALRTYVTLRKSADEGERRAA